MKAFLGMARFDPDRRFLPWVLGIAVNVCRNHRRAGARREVASDDVPGAEPLWSRPAPSPLEHLEISERAKLVHDWLDRLSADDRAILLLRYAEGLSHHELGEAYGRPEVVMRMRLHRAWKRLLGHIEGGAR
jgi:RNA polymerase sigma-70 factor (ECF subfamily)